MGHEAGHVLWGQGFAGPAAEQKLTIIGYLCRDADSWVGLAVNTKLSWRTAILATALASAVPRLPKIHLRGKDVALVAVEVTLSAEHDARRQFRTSGKGPLYVDIKSFERAVAGRFEQELSRLSARAADRTPAAQGAACQEKRCRRVPSSSASSLRGRQ
jgi:hypothetical protein